MAAWATIDDLADWLGVPQDSRMVDALAASQAACEHVRPDLVPVTPVGADVSHAVILYAALIYRERTTPQGFSAYESFDTAAQEYGNAVYNIRQLLGSRKPVAR